MGKLGKLILLEDIHAHPTHEHTTIYILAVELVRSLNTRKQTLKGIIENLLQNKHHWVFPKACIVSKRG